MRACPARAILHVTVGAADPLVATVSPWIHSLDPRHVPVVVVTAVPVGGLADWAGVRCIMLRKQELLFTI